MICPTQHSPYFLCLCSAEHQALLQQQCAASSHRLVFVETVDDVLRRGLEQPPLALILEISTSIRIGAERMSKFLNLGVNWPVMRCALAPDGTARVMCFEPPHGEPLLTALDAIAAGDPSWQHPRFKRRDLRLNLPGRVRLRVLGEERWRLGNLLGVSCGGCFVAMSADAPALETPLEVELVDFTPGGILVRGEVCWLRSWDESLEFPGIGIEFDPATINDEFRQYMTSWPRLIDLIAE